MKPLIDAAQASRAREQVAAVELGPQRVTCACGCGAWWYRPRIVGRPRKTLNADHLAWASARRKREARAAKICARSDRRQSGVAP